MDIQFGLITLSMIYIIGSISILGFGIYMLLLSVKALKKYI